VGSSGTKQAGGNGWGRTEVQGYEVSIHCQKLTPDEPGLVTHSFQLENHAGRKMIATRSQLNRRFPTYYLFRDRDTVEVTEVSLIEVKCVKD